jgi:hypothetical protein
MIVRIAGRNPACHAICHAMQVKKPGRQGVIRRLIMA